MTFKPIRYLTLAMISTATAGGMQIPFQNGSSLGIAFADTPLLINQASAAYYNPAVLTTVKHKQLQFGGNAAVPSITFSGTYKVYDQGGPGGSVILSSHINRAEGGYAGFLPNFFLALPINSRVTLGLGMASPYGLGLAFAPSTQVNYALKSDEIINVDFVPAIGVKLTPALSWGFGLDMQYLENTNSLDVGIDIGSTPTAIGESKDHLAGYALGFHTGLFYHINSQNQWALTFHQGSQYHLTGSSEFTFNDTSVKPIKNNNFSSNWNLPWWVSTGFSHQFNSHWQGMLKVQYTGWRVLQNMIVNHPAIPSFGPPAPTSITNDLNLSNSWTLVLGSTYRMNSRCLFQFGLAWDQGASNPTYRQIWLPDNDHYSAAIGVKYQLTPSTIVNIGYDFAYMAPAHINNPPPKAGHVPIKTDGVLNSTSSVIGFEITSTL